MIPELEPVPPCRRLRPLPGGGYEVIEVITERQRLDVDPKKVYFDPSALNKPNPRHPGPPARPIDMEAVLRLRAAGRTIEQIARELGVCHIRVGRALRERTKSVRNKRVDISPTQRFDITIEWIRERQAEGLTAKQMAERKGCDITTIFARLREYRRSSPERAAADALLRTCACGARKWASRTACAMCLKIGGAERLRRKAAGERE